MNTSFTLIYLLLLHFSVSVNSKAIDYRQDDEPKIIHDYAAIQSIGQLTSLFNGKPVYIDLWATWCEPCLDEFKYSREL